jgi:biopolymer transport protein TolR
MALNGGWRGEVTAEMNVTPMIDVMLVLLIIFMVVTPAMMGIRELPEANTAVPAAEDRVTLSVARDGAFAVDEVAVPEAELAARLTAAYAARNDGVHVLYLKAHRDADYARVLTGIEAARQAGVQRVAALTLAPAREKR